MNACTIIARNYLAHARVLARSFHEHHPDGTFSVLLIDDLGEPISAQREPFRLLRLADIGIERRERHRMAMMYTGLELATAVKPWLLRTLLDEDDHIVYLDPDIQVFAPLDEVVRLAGPAGIVLTPHQLTPAPFDAGAELIETILLYAGVYNLGFVAVARPADVFLDWWSERLARSCLVLPTEARFVDQRWMDFAPALFGAHILRDPAYNVAWWNVAARDVRRVGEGAELDGRPLRFFHFSGYDPDHPHLLSKHAGADPEVLLSHRPHLRALCDRYRERLLEEGYRTVIEEPYGFDQLPGGLLRDRPMREIYREHLLAAHRDGAPEPPNPYEPDEYDTFVAWLNEPPDRHGAAVFVSRYLHRLWMERPELQSAYPNLRWHDGIGLAGWASVHRRDAPIPMELVPRGVRGLPAPVAPRGEGVNMVGYLKAELGVGEAARQVLSALIESGQPTAVIIRSASDSREQHPLAEGGLEVVRPEDAPYDVNLICVNADRALGFRHDVGPAFFDDRYSIGVWWWEVESFPRESHGAFAVVDEVWVGSEFVAESIGRETSKPVRVMPLPVVVPPAPPLGGRVLGLPDDAFVFLFVFDYFSVAERKNPHGLVEAFRRAFAPGEGPVLVVKSINGSRFPTRVEQLRRAAAGRPDVLLAEEYLSSADKAALMAGCSCYVSLHRSEGFGLTIAEAMAYGRPAIATGYSGNLTYMDPETALLVDHELVPIPPATEPYPSAARWAQPDLDHAARLMRQVWERPAEAAAMGGRARAKMARAHSVSRAAEWVAERLAEIREGREAPAGVAGTR